MPTSSHKKSPPSACAKSGNGFTLIELLVVISIMGLLSMAMIANLAGQRVSRNIKIAQNELVTNIRKIQSFTLSSRNLPNNQAVQYYVLKFDLATPTQYKIQAMYNVSNSPAQLADVETVKFPLNIRLAAASGIVNPLQIDRPSPLSAQVPAYPSGCALVSFATPFAKTFMNNGCGIAAAPNINTGDDYQNVINFLTNTSAGSASSNSIMTITLTDVANTMTKKIIINGITGGVSFQ